MNFVTPAMSTPKAGSGSVYPMTVRDSEGNYLDGGETYSVTLPAPIPAKAFWSFMVYSGQHRSILETDQKLGRLDSLNPNVKPNADGSYTIWFAQKESQQSSDETIDIEVKLLRIDTLLRSGDCGDHYPKGNTYKWG
jgi:hypothetical protein